MKRITYRRHCRLYDASGMTLSRVAALALSFILLANTASLSAVAEPLRTISVSGTVATKVAPDQILWQVSLSSADQSLSKAKAGSDEQVKAVVALRQQLGIDEGDLQTGPVSVNREYERDLHGNRGKFKHFVVYRAITLRQRDLKRFDEFLNTLLASTQMEVSFSFESSRTQEVRAESRLKALEVAKRKATAMAEVLGAKVGRVLIINEHSPAEGSRNPVSNITFVESTPPADVASETFVPGAINLQVTVYLTFELE